MLNEFNFHLTIRSEHIDKSSHVNNACYLSFFEAARWRCFDGTIFDESKIHTLGFAPVLIDCQLKYRKELVLDDNISIKTSIIQIEKKMIIHINQVIYKQNGEKSCSAKLRHGILNLKTRNLTEIPDNWLNILLKEKSNAMVLT